MRLSRLALRLIVLAAATALVATTALADLRSADGTAVLGATLADDPAVRALVGTTVVDRLLDDAAATAPAVAALLPLVRPTLVGAVATALDAPTGRDALAATLTDAIRQLTFAGPVVLDLRPAVLAAADEAPPPLDTLARTAVERGTVGVIVLGEQEPGTTPVPRSADALARIAGLEASTATAAAWALLALALLVGLAPAGRGRSARLRAAAGPLLLVGTPAALLLRLAPERVSSAVTNRIADGAAEGTGELVAAVLPAIGEGVGVLLARTGDVALALAVTGAVLLVLSAAGSLRGADRRRRR